MNVKANSMEWKGERGLRAGNDMAGCLNVLPPAKANLRMDEVRKSWERVSVPGFGSRSSTKTRFCPRPQESFSIRLTNCYMAKTLPPDLSTLSKCQAIYSLTSQRARPISEPNQSAGGVET